jgi:hypothetical protein
MPSSISTVSLRRRAFIVDRERAAAIGIAAVIDHGHAGRGHTLADLARKGAGALAVEIAFKAVADRFVQQHAGPAGAEQHGHFARRRIDRTQVGQ